MTPYQKLIDLFTTVIEERNQDGEVTRSYNRGGKAKLAELLGVTPSLLSQWETRYNGEPPVKYYRQIVEAAASLGIARYKVDAVFAGCCCPTCGNPVAPVSVIEEIA